MVREYARQGGKLGKAHSSHACNWTWAYLRTALLPTSPVLDDMFEVGKHQAPACKHKNNYN